MAWQEVSCVRMCVAKHRNSTHNAPKRCHPRSWSRSAGLKKSETAERAGFLLTWHGRISGNVKKQKNHENPDFHGFSWFSMVLHISGKKCPNIAGKVVSMGGRDRKNTVWSHLVAEKLSVTSYFLSADMVWAGLVTYFSWVRLRPGWPTAFDSNTRNPENPGAKVVAK